MVLGQPEDVEAEPLGGDTGVEQPRGGIPHLLLGVPAVRGRRRAGTRIVHLHTTEQRHTGGHVRPPRVAVTLRDGRALADPGA